MSLINLTDINLEGSDHGTWSVAVDGYRYLLYANGNALVFKGDNKEPSYEITSMGCSCPGDRYSNSLCKHRKAVSYLGDGSAVPPIEGTAVRAKNPTITTENTVRGFLG